MFRTAAGKPRITIFSIAHLNDTERMFFVSLLLNEILNWTRAQTGTTSLRAMVYMDEIYGYFPPVRNPPSKGPLLTLLKQARAFGVGVVLATQNPVDLDYKGLANAGTWFIGRLQTERDKARLLDGLESAAEAASGHFDRARIEKILSGLGARVFLMNNVHEDAPVVFESRWALSYLRGPLTRVQIKTLMDSRQAAPGATSGTQAAAPVLRQDASPSAANVSTARPAIPPAIQQVFLALRGSAENVVYHPVVLGSAQIHFIDDKSKLDQANEVTFLTPVRGDAVPVKWEDAAGVSTATCEFEKDPTPGIAFADLPAPGAKAKSYDDWKKAFNTWIFANQKIELLSSPSSGEISRTGESERDFRARLQQAAREQRDAAVEALRQQYAQKLAAAEERVRRAQQDLAREQEQASSQRIQTALSVGGAILGAFFGRKALSRTNITAATSAARSAGRTYKEGQDVGRASETVEALEQQSAQLQDQLKQETAALQARTDPSTEALEKIVIRPKKTNITIRLFSLAWAPYRPTSGGDLQAAWE